MKDHYERCKARTSEGTKCRERGTVKLCCCEAPLCFRCCERQFTCLCGYAGCLQLFEVMESEDEILQNMAINADTVGLEDKKEHTKETKTGRGFYDVKAQNRRFRGTSAQLQDLQVEAHSTQVEHNSHEGKSKNKRNNKSRGSYQKRENDWFYKHNS